ncbi:MAG: hypothetical protein JWQ71_368, partial [Pedosphaera sp.]|nr:hypothetical protein [Pedosphaera sp.]
LANLTENTEISLGWFVIAFHTLPCGRFFNYSPAFFLRDASVLIVILIRSIRNPPFQPQTNSYLLVPGRISSVWSSAFTRFPLAIGLGSRKPSHRPQFSALCFRRLQLATTHNSSDRLRIAIFRSAVPHAGPLQRDYFGSLPIYNRTPFDKSEPPFPPISIRNNSHLLVPGRTSSKLLDFPTSQPRSGASR